MKKLIIVLCFSVSVLNAQNMELFNKFHDYFAKRDWKKMDKLIREDFQLIDWNKKVTLYKEGYLDYMKNWNGTMGTTWTIFSSSEKDGKVYSTERDTDPFLETFYGVSATFAFTYEFKDDKLYRLSYDTLPGYQKIEDTFVWNYNNFMLWVQQKHPEELPNMNMEDQKKSAQTHLKLMKLWKER